MCDGLSLGEMRVQREIGSGFWNGMMVQIVVGQQCDMRRENTNMNTRRRYNIVALSTQLGSEGEIVTEVWARKKRTGFGGVAVEW